MNQNKNDELLIAIYSLLRTYLLSIAYVFGTMVVMLTFISIRAYDAGYTITISNIFSYLLNVDLVLFFKNAGIFIFIALIVTIYINEEKLVVPNTFPYSIAMNAVIAIACLAVSIWLMYKFVVGIPQLHLFGR